MFSTSILKKLLIVIVLLSVTLSILYSDPKSPNRMVKVVTVSQANMYETNSKEWIEGTMIRMDQAAAYKPDIVCLPEMFPRKAEKIPGPVSRLIGDWARKNSCYVILPLKTIQGDVTFNSALLIDRRGKIIGRYDKIHPTEGEIRYRTVPGKTDPPVFKTDFGTIGIQICFDVNWDDGWQRLKQKGAEIVFWPSAYPATRLLSALAFKYEYYIVSSTMSRQSSIFDITGEIIDSSGSTRQWAIASLPMGKRLFEIDFHMRKIREIEKKYGYKLEVNWYHDDDWFTLASLIPDLTVENIIKEFDLLPVKPYHERVERAQEKARQKLSQIPIDFPYEPVTISYPYRNRIVRVATVTQDGKRHDPPDELLEKTFTRMNEAAAYKPDILCLPEYCPKRAEAVPGPITKRFSDWAREHSCYVILPLKTLYGKIKFNSALLIDRNGEIVGQYNKIRPTEGEINGGIIPGPVDPPVFKTDFGTIGIQICFDAVWDDGWKRLKEKGAEIVFFASAYPAARQIAALAWQNEFYIVSSTMKRKSSIFDITGDILSTSGGTRQWAFAELPLGKKLFEIDYHIDKMRQIEKKYGNRVEVKWFHNEDWVTLASRVPELTTQDIINEFGLLPIKQYHKRCEAAQDKARNVFFESKTRD